MIACNRIERGKKHPTLPNFENIEAHSNGPKVWQPLSPFNLGPFPVTEKYNPNDIFADELNPGWTKFWNGNEWMQTITCLSFERYWQGGKVYPVDLTGTNNNHNNVIFQGKTLNKNFYYRRIDMFTNPNRAKASIRHPLPKAKHGVPIQGYYSNEFLDYVTSRKKYYCPGYEYFAWHTEEYKLLLKKHFNNENLQILGYDGINVEINENNMRNIINNPKYIFGHELVLCCMLLGLKPWLD